MPSALQEDLKNLDALAFSRRECVEADIRRYHALRRKVGRAFPPALRVLHCWMLVPITLWPLNIHDVYRACLDCIEAGKELDAALELLLQHLREPPDEAVCRTVAEHEHQVQAGDYDSLIKAQSKFDSIEKEAARNPELASSWEEIKKCWDVSQYADHKGVIRRSLTTERNLRPDFSVDWNEPSQRFRAIFDAFCARWQLYGMRGDEPLTMKLSVNLTPHGTMIFIPAYWSFDAKRDIRWDAVRSLHGARALKKQGPGLSESYEERRAMAAKLRQLDAEVKRLRLKGDERHAFLCKGLGVVIGTSPKRFSNLRREFQHDDQNA